MNGLDFSKPEDANQRDEMIKGVTNQNTQAIKSAKDSMSFENIESLEQGAGTLYAITVRLFLAIIIETLENLELVKPQNNCF